MAVLNCKMCGAPLQNIIGRRVVVCEYCGSEQTVPNMDDDKKARLFDKANLYRLNNEFDKAAMLFESIILNEPSEAEAYWGLCLCKYGVIYEEEPQTKNRVITCSKIQYNSILDDEDYINVLNNADVLSKEVYVREANWIDKIQKDNLALVSSGEEYDVFISYKESDERGEITEDSQIAFSLYEKLTAKGYKVFFSKITLQKCAGENFDAVIFSALNSAKVMLLVGTKLEYINSTWVKNEWSRYLYLMDKDKTRTLIPVIRELRPEELPENLRYLQVQDFSKLGAEQDLLYNLANKILGYKEEKDDKQVGYSINSTPFVEIERRKNGPDLIDYVVAKGANKENQYFPNGGALSVIDVEQFDFVAIQGNLKKAFHSEKDLEVGVVVYDNNTKNIVYKNIVNLHLTPKDTIVSLIWQINGSDGSHVSAGTYTAGIWIGESRVTTLNLVIKAHESSMVSHEKYEEMRREIGTNPKEYLLKRMIEKKQNEVNEYIQICKKMYQLKKSAPIRVLEGVLGMVLMIIASIILFNPNDRDSDVMMICLLVCWIGQAMVMSAIIKCRAKNATKLMGVILVFVLFIPNLFLMMFTHDILGGEIEHYIWGVTALLSCIYAYKLYQYAAVRKMENSIKIFHQDKILPLENSVQEELYSKYSYYVGQERVVILGTLDSEQILEVSKTI